MYTPIPRRIPLRLLHLPEEILIQIIASLDIGDSFAVLASCKYLYSLSKTSTTILYAQETQFAGVVDNASCPDVIATRLLALQKREQAWRQLSFSAIKSVIVPHVSSGIYDLTGGRYFLGRTDNVPTPMYHRGPTKAICSLSLSDCFDEDSDSQSTVAGKHIEWPSIDVGEDIIDVGINISELDLIGVVKTAVVMVPGSRPKRRVSLHLIQLSTGAPHPQAQKPVISVYEGYDLDSRPGLMLEIVGDVLALLLNWGTRDSPDVLYIMDWKAGNITMQRTAETSNYSAFVFLSPNVLALPCQRPFSIELIRLPSTWDTPPAAGEEPAPLKVTRTLALPALADEVWVTHFSCRAEPNPNVYGQRYGRARNAAFMPDPKDAIVLFHVLVRKITAPIIWGEASSMSFVAHRATLLSLVDPEPLLIPSTFEDVLIPRYRTAGVQTESVDDVMAASVKVAIENLPEQDEIDGAIEQKSAVSEVVPWASWGSKATHWITTDHIMTNWITTSCGTRLVMTESPEVDDQHSTITIYDFNWNRVKKAINAARIVAEADADIIQYPADALENVPGSWSPFDVTRDFASMQDDPAGGSTDQVASSKYYAYEEWALDAEDRVLGYCERAQQSGDIRLMASEIPLSNASRKYFREDVISGLPYIVVQQTLEGSYQSVLMEEECLIGLKSFDIGGTSTIDVLRVG